MRLKFLALLLSKLSPLGGKESEGGGVRTQAEIDEDRRTMAQAIVDGTFTFALPAFAPASFVLTKR